MQLSTYEGMKIFAYFFYPNVQLFKLFLQCNFNFTV